MTDRMKLIALTLMLVVAQNVNGESASNVYERLVKEAAAEASGEKNDKKLETVQRQFTDGVTELLRESATKSLSELSSSDLVALAKCAELTEQPQQCEKYALAAIERKPDESTSYFMVIRSYFNRGELAAGAKVLATAERQFPTDRAINHFNLYFANRYLQSVRNADAKWHLERFLGFRLARLDEDGNAIALSRSVHKLREASPEDAADFYRRCRRHVDEQLAKQLETVENSKQIVAKKSAIRTACALYCLQGELAQLCRDDEVCLCYSKWLELIAEHGWATTNVSLARELTLALKSSVRSVPAWPNANGVADALNACKAKYERGSSVPTLDRLFSKLETLIATREKYPVSDFQPLGERSGLQNAVALVCSNDLATTYRTLRDASELNRSLPDGVRVVILVPEASPLEQHVEQTVKDYNLELELVRLHADEVSVTWDHHDHALVFQEGQVERVVLIDGSDLPKKIIIDAFAN